MVAVLTRIFGVQQLEMVEDVVQEAFYRALKTWSFNSVPDQPTAWLMQVARNLALDRLRVQKNRDRLQQQIAAASQTAIGIERLFHEQEIADSQLRLVFACCHPVLKEEDQLALTLKTAAGFGVREIARALLLGEEAVKQRLHRARQRIIDRGVSLDIPAGHELAPRLETVLTVLYLLFNEGYHATQTDEVIRKDLCAEAMRLTKLVYEHPVGRASAAPALLALMCYHAARFAGRLDADRQIILLPEQDRDRWDHQLIRVGHYYMLQVAQQLPPTVYHLEAAIAAQHCLAPSFAETDWERLDILYTHLYRLKPNPIVLLNRVVVLRYLGRLDEAHRLLDTPILRALAGRHHLYHAILAELATLQNRPEQAAAELHLAITLAGTEAERGLLRRKLAEVGKA